MYIEYCAAVVRQNTLPQTEGAFKKLTFQLKLFTLIRDILCVSSKLFSFKTCLTCFTVH